MRLKITATVECQRDALVAALRNSAAAALNAGAVSMQSTMRLGLNRVSGWKSVPGGYPGNSKGTLHRSIAVSPARPDNLVARVGTGQAHGAHMQWGVKKSSKWLTVPLNKKARDMLAAAGSVRSIPGLKWMPSKPGTGGLLVLPLKSSKRARRKFIPMFILKSAVAARPWATLALKEGKGMALEAIRTGYARSWRAESARFVASVRGAK